MADRYLLESGAPDGYLLEDGSGVYLLESSGGGSYTAPTRRNSTTATGTGTNVGGTPGNYTAAITLNKPSGVVDGDLLFTVISTDGNAVGLVQTLSGWTAMGFNPLRPTTDGQRVYVFWKIASGEGASWTWSTDTNNGNDWTGTVVAYYGQNATWNVDSDHSTVSSASNSSPVSVSDSGVTTSTPNTLLLYIGAGDPNTNNSGSWSDPSGYTAGSQSYANYAPVMFADKVQATAGASGSVAGTLTFASGAAGYAAAVIPITGTASGGGQSATVGRADETDTASALARQKSKATGLATETDAASALARVKSRGVGLATSTEAASALGRVKSKPVGLATETDSALSLVRGGMIGTTGLAIETDLASALSRAKVRAVQLASETSSAFALARIKSRPVGLAVEADHAFALAGGGPAETIAPEWIMRHRRRARR